MSTSSQRAAWEAWVAEHDDEVVRINARDPTESKGKRQSFRSAFWKRWREVRGENRSWLDVRENLDTPGVQAEYRRFFESMATNTVLEPVAPRKITDGRHWTAKHITTAYDKGLELADRDLSGLGASDQLVAEATRRNDRRHRRQLKRQYESIYYTTTDHITYATSKATDKLREALENGRDPSWLRDAVNEMIRSKVQNRYRSAANTAINRTINEAMLTAFEIAGVTEVGVAVESSVGSVDVRANMVRVNAEGELVFETAGDLRVCPTCASLAGTTVKISEVRGRPDLQPPIHPGCRCRLVATKMETGGETIEAPTRGPGLRAD